MTMIGNLIQKPTRIRNNPVSLTGRINKGKKLNFTSQPLWDVNIKDSNGNYVPAKITLLDISEPKDASALDKLINIWKGAKNISSILAIFQNMPKQITMAVELDDPNLDLDKRIKSIVSIDPGYPHMYINSLQADPATKFGTPDRAFSGAGELLMYGICKYALENKYTKLKFISTNHEFYNHIGITKAKSINFVDKKAMWNFIDLIEQKYNFSPKMQNYIFLNSDNFCHYMG